MINNKRVLVTICARKGSKGLPNKNTMILNDRAIISYTLDSIKNSRYVDDFIVSTDSIVLKHQCRHLGVSVEYERPVSLSHDTTPKLDTILAATEYFESRNEERVDIIVDLDIGVPLRNSEDVDGAIECIANNNDMDALVTVYKAERNPYFNMVEQNDSGFFTTVKSQGKPVYCRQDAPVVYSITPAVFAWKRDKMHFKHTSNGNWGIYEMPISRSIDIDSKFELDIIKSILNG